MSDMYNNANFEKLIRLERLGELLVRLNAIKLLRREITAIPIHGPKNAIALSHFLFILSLVFFLLIQLYYFAPKAST